MRQISGTLSRRASTLVDLLDRRVHENPEKRAFSFLADGESAEHHLTYADLDARARAIGALLQQSGMVGERVLLLYPSGLDFVTAFLGCLYGGAVAVPAAHPGGKRSLPRLRAIARDARPRAVLCTAASRSRLAALTSPLAELRPLRWLVTDGLDGALAEAWAPLPRKAEDLAFLQYTSGSTAAPKGVMVSHGNLLHNEEMIRRAFEQSRDSVIVGWLPLFHDMGLIGNVLQPLYLGASCVLMPPIAFLQNPGRWLRAITRYRATTSGGPNFAYDLCVRRISAAEREGLDLSSWRLAFNGAEPVRAATLEAFAAAFAPSGFRREAFYPCYGLAEATLFVSGGAPGAPVRSETFDAAALEAHQVAAATGRAAGRGLVSCGRVWLDQEVAIVHPETRRLCAAEEVGEIWVRGASVAQGYWRQPAASARDFGARPAEGDGDGAEPYLRTGDLGFTSGGELFVTGRLKDLIILRGRNHYPQDIEQSAEGAHRALRPGCGAAFAVEVEREERLVVVWELDRHYKAAVEEVAEAVRRVVGQAHEVQVYEVVLVRAATIPKTSSGKIRRYACRAARSNGSLKVIGRSVLAEPAAEREELALDLSRETLLALEPDERRPLLVEYVRSEAAAAAGVSASRIAPDQPLTGVGLDSLGAVELKHALESSLEVSIPLRDFLEGATTAGLSRRIEARLEDAERLEGDGGHRIPERPETGELPLSYGQRALWFLQDLAPESAAYHITAAARVRGPLDAAALRRAFRALAERHGALRATFELSPSFPQGTVRVDRGTGPELSHEDASAWSESRLLDRLHEEAYRSFDLAAGPLLRVGVWTRRGTARSAEEHVVLLAVHHIVADFWSLAVAAGELGVLYRRETGSADELPAPPRLHYADYVRWQERMLSGPRGERLWDYWRQKLGGTLPELDLPTDRPRPPAQSYRGASGGLSLGGGLTGKVRSLARSRGATLHMTLLAALQTLLYRYTGQEDLVVGSPTSGRSVADFAGVVGYFVNPVALRGDLGGRPTFEGLLGRTRRTALEAFEHQDYPFALLAERLQPEREPSRPPIFQVMFVLYKERSPAEAGLAGFALGRAGARMKLGDLPVECLPLERRGAQFDLTLIMAEVEGTLAAELQYSTDLFDRATALRLLGHFETLLEAVADRPGSRLGALPLLRPAERAQLVTEWNDTAGGRAPAAPIHELIAAQAARTPHAVAVVHGAEHLAYRQLDERAGRLGRRLRRLGVGPETLVGVCLERSLDWVVGLLGVVKAGGAFVPLDPAYPQDRLTYMIEDAALPLVLTDLATDGRLAATAVSRLCLESEREAAALHRPELPAGPTRAENLAYVIYTSGSTGRPKGVALCHGGLVNLAAAQRSLFGLGRGDRVLQFSALSFDASVWEVVMALVPGATLVLGRAAELVPGAGLRELVDRQRVNVATLPPSALAAVGEDELGGLETLIVAGEAATDDLVDRWGPRRRFWNAYGPTEGTVCATAEPCRAGGGTPSIGRPIDGTTSHVVDRLEPVPVGVPGELAIGGAGLARGYLRRPGLSAEKLVPDPWSAAAGARLYRTGDLVRRQPDGKIFFLGRIDSQVKIRGFRIELGEIEAQLSLLEAVRDAVAVVRDDLPGGRGLLAYVVPDSESPPEAGELPVVLKERLGEKLPHYMVPAFFVLLEALPLLPNGKVDRRALPAPEAGSREREPAPLHAPMEELLAGVFSDLLGVERVSAGDSFFELGGHSLLATQLVSRVRELCGVELSLRRVFETPTVRQMARGIEESLRAGQGLVKPPIERVPRDEPPPLSFAQQRLWFLFRLDPASPVYNIPLAVRLRGPVQAAALAAGLDAVVRRHEVLRTTFEERLGKPVQVIGDGAATELTRVDLRGLPAALRRRSAQELLDRDARRPFDLTRGPLLRATLLAVESAEHWLLLTMHHIASDGWSVGVLVRELGRLYDGFVAGRPAPLPALAVQYADFACWQRRWLSGEVLAAQVGFWKERLRDAPPLLGLPTDRPRPLIRRDGGASRPFRFPAELLRRVRASGQRHGATLFMVLLAAFKALLKRYSGQSCIVVGTPIAGRGHLQTEGLIGFFVNTLVLRTDLARQMLFAELLDRVRGGTLAAYRYQDLPFEKLVEELAPARDLSYTPLFQVMFALQNMALGISGLSGLEVEPLPADSGTAKYDLTFTLLEAEDRLNGAVEYDRDLFDGSTVERMTRSYLELLAGAVSDPERRLETLPLLAGTERHQLLVEWNVSPPRAFAARGLHELFAAQAGRTPAAPALVSGREWLSYAELEARSNRLAHLLRRRGVGPEVRVGVCLERTAQLVVSLLAVLKAGGAYVPLDPAYPARRRAFMLEDSGARLVLAREPLSETGVTVDPGAPGVAAESAEPPAPSATVENLAYVIYTSGSTGRPKGVAIEHRSAAELAHWARQAYSARDLSGVLAATSVCFDLSVFEIFVPLAWGGRVLLAEDALALASLPAAPEVTLVNTVPSAMAALVEDALPASLETVNLAGEPLKAPLAEAIYGHPQVSAVWNLYGPSEDTTYSTAARVARGAPRVTIGRPLPGGLAHVADGSLELLPVGVPGELLLAGPGLARGYLGRPGLTAQRFIPHGPATAPGVRLYRTGDLVRRLPDGELDFLGRLDYQVKVRGYRIEPGEIESALLGAPGVREAVVVVQGDGFLVAYVAAARSRPATAELRRRLAAKLPEHMVPAAFVLLEALPRTPNGKVDRRALPAPDGSAKRESLPLRSPMEELLAGIFSDLLGVERVFAGDSFFELGGHSLLATRLVSRVRELCGVELSVRRVFETPTVRRLAEGLEEGLRAGPGLARPPIEPVPRGEPLPLSFAQQRLWFLFQLDPASPVYNIPLAVRLRGPVHVPALAAGLDAVVRRHEVLRTAFEMHDGEPVQVIAAGPPPGLARVDLRGLPAPRRRPECRNLTREGARRPFDLARGHLLRATLAVLGEQEHTLLLVFHHIVSDGWSTGVLLRELKALYAAAAAGRPAPLGELPIQYGDFACWQRRWLSGAVLEAKLEYWKERLGHGPPVLRLPTDRPRPAVQTYRGASRSSPLTEELAAEVRKLGSAGGTTPFMTLLAAFQALLGRYGGQVDVAVGTPVAGRDHLRTEELIGCFVNTLVLRSDLSGEPSFRRVLGRVREAALEAFAHQELPFEKLVEELAPERDLSHTPLFQVMFILQNAPLGPLSMPGLTLEPQAVESGTAKFDLTASFAESGDGLAAAWEYNRDLFDAATIQRMTNHFRVLLREAVADPGRRLGELALLTAAERQQPLEWNPVAAPRGESCLHQLFEARVERRPDAVAVVGGTRSLSYRELNTAANRVAWGLRRHGVDPKASASRRRVAVSMARGPETVAALLGILKAGASYVPIDPAYPAERRRFVLEDCGARMLVADNGRRIEGAGIERVGVDVLAAAGEGRKENPVSGVAADDLAYAIYTSGSTGRPKGVEISHRALVSFLASMLERPGFGAGDVLLAVTSLSFDIAGLELYLPLLGGGRVELAPAARTADGPELRALVESSGATVVQATPATWRMLLDAGWTPRRGLRVLCGGEALPAELAAALVSGGAATWNLYGPTETTIWSSLDRVAAGAPITLGRPIANTRLYVLDPTASPVPVGVPGELYIGGEGVARGYLERPALTAERFVPDPLAHEAGRRLYRTGDLVRCRPDGRPLFLGRMDHQVKVRGFRIELGEIETALRRHPAVGQAAVLVRGRADDPVLMAWVVPEGEMPPAEELRGFVRQALPEYMVPARFAALDALPLTPNRKVDRAALAALEVVRGEPEHGFVAPRSATEETLAGIFAEALGLGEVGVRDHFFDLGGHSLSATRVVSRIRDAFRVELPVRAVFESPSVAGLAARLERAIRASGEGPPPIAPAPRHSALPLSFAQQRLWFIHQLDPESPAYNLPAVIRLRGPLRAAALRAALEEVVRRHEALRTTFESGEGEPVQRIAEPGEFDLPRVDLAALGARHRAAEARRLLRREARRPFALSRGPLLRGLLTAAGGEDHTLLLAMHHIVSDGWSLNVLMRELAILYRAGIGGRPSPLPELGLQYADYAVWQRSWLRAEELESRLAYWRERLAGSPPVTALPIDRPRPQVRSGEGARLKLALSEGLTRDLRAFGQRHGATLFMAALTAFAALLTRSTGQAEIVVGTDVANRTRPQIEGLIGFFVNQLVLRIDLSGNPSAEELLSRIRRVALDAYSHQEVPFEKLVEALDPERSLSHSPLYQVAFGLQQAEYRTLELPGVDAEPLEIGVDSVHFDLEVDLADGPERLEGGFQYSAELFDATTIHRLCRRFRAVLAAQTACPTHPIRDLELLDPAERQQLLSEWNDAATPLPLETLFDRHFEIRAARGPEAVAAACDRRWLSYGELERLSGRLAGDLERRGLEPEGVVALVAGRGIEFLMTVLAILRAGGVYLPLDPEHPADRLARILEQSRARFALAARDFVPKVTGAVAALTDPPGVLELEGLLGAAAAGARSASGRAEEPSRLAYVIYTSGSTGVPKGAMVEHRGMLNHLYAKVADLELGADDIVAQTASQIFDISVWQFLAALLVGARVQIYRDEIARDPAALLARISAERVTVLETVPSLLTLQLDELQDASGPRPELGSLRWLIPTGEALAPELCRRWFSEQPGIPLLNAYGPTECSDDVTHYRFRRLPAGMARVPIGRPVANTRLQVLDRGLRPVPIGVAGELCVAGTGVGRGYLENPRRTAVTFVADPLAAGGRLYKTGDLVRALADGNLDFFGRIDHQVKIRGQRIELGEIEVALGRLPGFQQAAVVTREGPGRQLGLVAFAVTAAEAAPALSDLRRELRKSLPEAMIPARFEFLESLPLTPQGKVDRRALSRMALAEPEGPEDDRERAAPRTRAEHRLVEIWSEVLGLSGIGTDDDFFDLGGHSLLATQLVAKLRRDFRVDLPLRTLFEAPTITALAAEIERLQGERRSADAVLPAVVPDAGARHQPFPLNDIQQAYWIGRGATVEMGNVATHIYSEVDLDGLDLDRFTGALRRLIARHDMLRMVVLPDGRQRILEHVPPYEIELTDLAGRSAEEVERVLAERRAEMSHQVLPTDRWPLFEVRAARFANGKIRLYVSLDLLICDAWSWQIAFRELSHLYEQPESSLPPLGFSFRDYVLAEAALEEHELYRRSRDYWLARLDDLPPAPQLPLAKSPGSIEKPRFVRMGTAVEPPVWQRLRERASRIGVTPSALLLAVFAEVLTVWSKTPRFTVNLTLFRRLPFHPEVGRIVGDFTSLTLLAIDNSRPASFEARARRIQQQLWDDLDHAHFSAVRVLRELARRQGGPARAAMPVVFTSVLALDDNMRQDLPRGALQAEPVYSVGQTPQVWLDFQVEERDGGEPYYYWDAVSELFPEGLLEDMFAACGRLIRDLAGDERTWRSERRSLVSAEQLDRRDALNLRPAPVPDGLLSTAAAAQAGARPRHPAVISTTRTLTYEELFHRAGHLGRLLRQRGALPNRLVAVAMEKGWEQVLGVLGVHFSGAAYLPVDPALPPERVAYLLENGGVKQVLTQSWHDATLEWPDGVERLSVDTWNPAAGAPEPLDGPVQTAGDLAYVIYTSGSSGKPKGVMIDHRGALNTIADVNRRFAVGPADRVFALSSLSFDLSVYDIFGTLAAGATVIVPDPWAGRDPSHWLELLEREEVTVWSSVPALMEMLLEYLAGSGGGLPPSLRLVMLSGDWIPVDQPDRIRALATRSEGIEVISLGGATEASIWSILYPIGEVDPAWKSIPYGYAMDNQSFHVLDDNLEPRPAWVPGQLYIGGVGLALGYWRDPEKTAAAFVRHPVSGDRLYRTGDLGFYRPDGAIEFLGREDLQVKVQGHRIELGEIEAALAEHPGVRSAVVTAHGPPRGDRRLVAYVVPDRDLAAARPEAEELGSEPLPAEWEAGGAAAEHSATGAGDGAAASTDADVLVDPVKVYEFKLRQPGRRREPGQPAVRMPRPELDESEIDRWYVRRRSYREFLQEPIRLASLSELLSCLLQQRLEGEDLPKYRYGSAGSLYPVQVYLHVRPGRVQGLVPGAYYYDPAEHELVLLTEDAVLEESIHAPSNRPMFRQAAFSIFLIAEMRAITPIYGELSRHFATLEAGLISQLLEMTAVDCGLGLCQVGSVEFAALRAPFALGESHVLVHSLLGGGVGGESLAAPGGTVTPWREAVPDPAPPASPEAAASRAAAGAGPEDGAAAFVEELKRFLGDKLPPYMVPSTVMVLESLPLSANGKVDRRALPEPDAPREEVRPEFREPRSEVERELAAIVAELLGVEKVGVHDSFFELGGNSVHLVRFHARLRDRYQTDFSLVEMFRHPTIASLAELLRPGESSEAPAEPAPAAPAESRAAGKNRLQQRLRIRQKGRRDD